MHAFNVVTILTYDAYRMFIRTFYAVFMSVVPFIKLTCSFNEVKL